MGTWLDKLRSGRPEDFESVHEHSQELLQELIQSQSEDRSGERQQWAQDLGISPSVISHVLAGRRKLPRHALVRLGKSLRHPVKA